MKKIFLFLCFILFSSLTSASSLDLLNVSYSATRELYQHYNQLFIKKWQDKYQQTVKIHQSHGASGAQARAVIAGLDADIVTLALAYDIDEIAKKGKLLNVDWQTKFANNSCPYTSTIVLLVKKGNPKKIKDWDDLIQPNVSVITPNPKTSGAARWSYLAAWAFAVKKNNGNENLAQQFMQKLYKNAPVLDSNARTSTATFVQRNIGDVLIAWENDALLLTHRLEKEKFEIIYPSLSIIAETPVAVVTKNTEKKGTTLLATNYLNELYSDEAQRLIAEQYFRPSNSTILANFKNQFPDLPLITIKDLGGWQNVQKKHFSDGGLFDQIYNEKK